MDDRNVEQELLADLLIYGASFHKIVDGRKVRIDPKEVYIMPPKRRPLLGWLLRAWVWIKRLPQRIWRAFSASEGRS